MKQQVMIGIDQNDQYVEHLSICIFNSTIFNVKKKRKRKTQRRERREQQIAVIIIVYVYVCMMQSTSIEKNDTLNYYIERLFFCCSEPTV